MEVSLISVETIRLRGKQATLLMNPIGVKIKTPIDATLFYQRASSDFNASDLEGNKVIIDGAGEYEVGGVKISGSMLGPDVYYTILMDGIDTLIGKASTLSKIKSDSKECQIAIIESDVLLDQSIAASINPSVLLFYGNQASENIKSLGKEEVTPMSKFSITKEKLPTETQIVLLQ